MEAAEAKVQRVLEGSRQFLIPHFQRPYSWREKQWDVLWRDLVELVEDPSSQPHFLGSIVSSPARSIPEGVEKRLLIDGQQRLTTVLVILALVRVRALEQGNTKLAEKTNDLITNRHEDRLDRYKLLPTQGDGSADSDRDAFVGLIDRRIIESSSGINTAAAFFSAKLQRTDAPPLEDVFRVMTSKLTLVSIILDDKDNPHRIFESLNGKGRPLSQADLIRNFFFMRLPDSEHEAVYRTLWQPMQKRLGEETLTEFIRHYLMHFGTVVNESDIYTTLKRRVDDQDRAPLEQLQELATYSKYYEVLVDPSKAPSVPLRERLDRLRRLEVTVAFPFLLPVYADFARGTLNEAVLCEVLDIVETYVVRRFVCGVATHGLNKVFTPLYQQVRKKEDFIAAVRSTLAERACPRDEQFRERLDGTRLYGGGERREKTKLVLERLERALGHKERVVADNLTIEHVMPQTLTPWWKEHLGEDWEDDHGSLLHTLGNLTLTSYNSELSNESYPEKRALLDQSHLELNRYFGQVEHWNAGEIERRADSLIDLALTVWPYFGPAALDEPIRESSDVTSTLPNTVVFRGQKHSVRSWAEVLVCTLERIIEAAPDDFLRLETEMDRLISRDPSTLRRARRLRRLSNGAFVETNLSAAAIHRLCLQALQVVDMGPDEWSVEYVSLRGDDEAKPGEATSEVKLLQGELWTEVRRALVDTQEFSSLPSARPQHWFTVALGRRGFSIGLIANVTKARLEVRLSLNDEGAANGLAVLMADREAVEREVGAALDWDTNPESRRRTIRLVHDVDLRDRTGWPAAVAWVTRTTVAFKAAFGPRIAAMDS